jgi:hypothetical protein
MEEGGIIALPLDKTNKSSFILFFTRLIVPLQGL